MKVSSVRIESRLNRVWMWKSANALRVGGRPVASRSSVNAVRRSVADAAIVTERISSVRHQALAELPELLERHAGANRDAVEGVLGDVARDPGHLGQQLVEVAKERAAAGHHHPLVDDVGAELGRRLLEHVADRGDDRLEWLLDGLG